MHDRRRQINIVFAIGSRRHFAHPHRCPSAGRSHRLFIRHSVHCGHCLLCSFAVETGPTLKSLSCLHPAVIGPDTRPSTAEPSLRQRFLPFPSLSPSCRDAAKRPGIPRQRCRFWFLVSVFLLPACPRRSIRWPFPRATVQPQPPLATRQTAFTNKVFPKREPSVSHVAMGTGARCGPWA
jgi:hypothetical protein